jgi:hypothetical protein
MASDFKITDELLTTLRGDVVQRRIKTSVEWFRANREKLLSLDPDQKNAAALVGYLSQWVDMGYGEAAVVRELLRRFPQSTRVTLPVYDYIHLELAEGMVAAAEEEIEKAIARFDVVIALGEAIGIRNSCHWPSSGRPVANANKANTIALSNSPRKAVS